MHATKQNVRIKHKDQKYRLSIHINNKKMIPTTISKRINSFSKLYANNHLAPSQLHDMFHFSSILCFSNERDSLISGRKSLPFHNYRFKNC